jgi:hypothetical protein
LHLLSREGYLLLTMSGGQAKKCIADNTSPGIESAGRLMMVNLLLTLLPLIVLADLAGEILKFVCVVEESLLGALSLSLSRGER